MKKQLQLIRHFADSEHPEVKKVVADLCKPGMNRNEKFDALYNFVKNKIEFGFPPVWNFVRASETLHFGKGYCNTKAILIQALCNAAMIPFQLRVGHINVRIMKKIFPNWAMPFLPRKGAHMWAKVELEDGWHEVDGYILDEALFQGAKSKLFESKRKIGFGLGPIAEKCDGSWNGGFIQTDALVQDNGIWDDAIVFYRSPEYKALRWIDRITLPRVLNMSNENIKKLRAYGETLLTPEDYKKIHHKEEHLV